MAARVAAAQAVVTLTINPAVDLYTSTARVRPTHKLRCGPALVHPGGGGINVARVLTRLGVGARALYPAGGVTGRLLRKLLDEEQVANEALAIAGETRESFSVHEDASGLDYRFVLPGPALSESEWTACLRRAIELAGPGALFVASGSLPPGVPLDFQARLARELAARDVRFVLDASGEPLAQALRAGVYLAKPSLRELREVAAAPLPGIDEQFAACRRLVRSGQAQVVALSLGADGAMLVAEGEAWRAPALDVPVASTIGAGDSFLGGLVAALVRGEDLRSAFGCAMAASAAALLASGTALCTAADVQRLLPRVRIQPLR